MSPMSRSLLLMVSFTYFSAKKIIIEGCENQKGNEFKKIAETGGKKGALV